MVDKASQRLGKDISKLRSSRNMMQGNKTLMKLCPNKMAIYLNMFGPFMKDRIIGNVNGYLQLYRWPYTQPQQKIETPQVVSWPSNQ